MRATRDPARKSTSSRGRCPGSARTGGAIASPRLTAMPRSAPMAFTLTTTSGCGSAATSGMVAWWTSWARPSNPPSIPSRWRIPRRTGSIRPLSEGTRRSSPRSSSTGLTPTCSRRCGAGMCSSRNRRNRSTSALPRGSRRSRARERSVNSARSGTPRSTARRRRTSTSYPPPRSEGGSCTSAVPSASSATTPRDSPMEPGRHPTCQHSRRGRTPSPCTALPTSASRRTSTTTTTQRPIARPTPTGLTLREPRTSITGWVQTPTRRPP